MGKPQWHTDGVYLWQTVSYTDVYTTEIWLHEKDGNVLFNNAPNIFYLVKW